MISLTEELQNTRPSNTNISSVETKSMASQAPGLTYAGKTWEVDQSDMDLVNVKDKGGNPITFQIFNGKYYVPVQNPKNLRGIKTFKLRDDDIYFPGYFRTGTFWTFERITMLLQGKAEIFPGNKGLYHIENVNSDEFNERLSPRLVCTHMQLSDGPDELTEKKCKVIYTLRDPKDVAVSLYHYYSDIPQSSYKGEFNDFLYLFLEGKVDCDGMFDHMRDAERFFSEHPDIPVHFMVYEESIKNPKEEIQRLSDFMNIKRDDDLCQAIADKCGFSRLKVDKDEFSIKVDGRNFLYRKGIVGDWRNYFTEEMLEDYYRVYEEKMAGSMFYDRYSREKYT